MKTIAFLSSKAFFFAISSGLAMGCWAYLFLSDPPRLILPGEPWPIRLMLSRDSRYVVVSQMDSWNNQTWRGVLRVWDTRENRLLFSVPHSEGNVYSPAAHGMAFTQQEDMLVVYGHGTAKYHAIPSGKVCEPDMATTFPYDKDRDVTSGLIQDHNGDLFVLVRDWKKGRCSIHDLRDGSEIWSVNRRNVWFGDGMLMDRAGSKTQLWEVRTGKICAEFSEPESKNGFGSLTFTPDGRTAVFVDGKIHQWRDGEECVHELVAHQFPALSPDGRFLAARRFRYDRYPNWLKPFLSSIGVAENNPSLGIYDLATGEEVASMPHADLAFFSRDGKTLAVTTQDSIQLYDLPLRRPWGRIIAIALVASASVFLFGKWLGLRQQNAKMRVCSGERS